MIKLGVFLVCGWLSNACFQSHRIDKIGKSERNQIEWVVWNIPLDPSSEFIKDGQVRYVVCAPLILLSKINKLIKRSIPKMIMGNSQLRNGMGRKKVWNRNTS